MMMREGESWRDFMTRCALAHDTSMARAFLCALGIPAPKVYPRYEIVAKVDKFADADECMDQRYGVRM